LRSDVFARGEYSFGFGGLAGAKTFAAKHHEDLLARKDVDDEGDGPQSFTPGQRPGTKEELLEMVAEDGTHSVLDIEQTGPSLGFGVAPPMPPRRIRQLFCSYQPAREEIEQNWGEAAEEIERWQAYYLTVHRDGEPHEYAFISCSGD
jgi:hypothetical protein